MIRWQYFLLWLGFVAMLSGCEAATDAPPTIEATQYSNVCSIAHEPATKQCAADYAYVMRCPIPNAVPSWEECEAPLDASPLGTVWCCNTLHPYQP